MKASKSYQPPEPNFQPGDRVRFVDRKGKSFLVIDCTHTHTQLEDFPSAVPNWQLKRVRKAKKQP